MPPPAALLSACLGWGYFAAWSVSFYPQVILNYRRKRVDGLSTDFVALNIIGFTAYAIFTCAFYFSGTVQRQYRDRNNGQSNLVAPQDVFFALHALALASITGVQMVVYRATRKDLSIPARTAILGVLATVVCFMASMIAKPEIAWLDLIYLCASVKLFVSFIKYLPQMILNYQQQSTMGWSIGNILLDFTGGSLSLLQLLLDDWRAWSHSGGQQSYDGSWFMHLWRANPAKLGLALLSLSFDIIFMYQHFALYRHQAPLHPTGSGEEAAVFLDDDEGNDGEQGPAEEEG
ncbi:hypothetical protein RI367_006252 [Sorochytrium milnesiophthora]